MKLFAVQIYILVVDNTFFFLSVNIPNIFSIRIGLRKHTRPLRNANGYANFSVVSLQIKDFCLFFFFLFLPPIYPSP